MRRDGGAGEGELNGVENTKYSYFHSYIYTSLLIFFHPPNLVSFKSPCEYEIVYLLLTILVFVFQFLSKHIMSFLLMEAFFNAY